MSKREKFWMENFNTKPMICPICGSECGYDHDEYVDVVRCLSGNPNQPNCEWYFIIRSRKEVES